MLATNPGRKEQGTVGWRGSSQAERGPRERRSGIPERGGRPRAGGARVGGLCGPGAGPGDVDTQRSTRARDRPAHWRVLRVAAITRRSRCHSGVSIRRCPGASRPAPPPAARPRVPAHSRLSPETADAARLGGNLPFPFFIKNYFSCLLLGGGDFLFCFVYDFCLRKTHRRSSRDIPGFGSRDHRGNSARGVCKGRERGPGGSGGGAAAGRQLRGSFPPPPPAPARGDCGWRGRPYPPAH